MGCSTGHSFSKSDYRRNALLVKYKNFNSTRNLLFVAKNNILERKAFEYKMHQGITYNFMIKINNCQCLVFSIM